MIDSNGNNADNNFETLGLHIHTITHHYYDDYVRHAYKSVGREGGAKRGVQSWLVRTLLKSVKGAPEHA